MAVHAPELGVVAQHGEGVEGVDEPFFVMEIIIDDLHDLRNNDFK